MDRAIRYSDHESREVPVKNGRCGRYDDYRTRDIGVRRSDDHHLRCKLVLSGGEVRKASSGQSPCDALVQHSDDLDQYNDMLALRSDAMVPRRPTMDLRSDVLALHNGVLAPKSDDLAR